MAAFERLGTWDIVLVPFPFSDRLAEKRRPALVISKSAMGIRRGHLWLAMVTSAREELWDTDVRVTNLALSGLPAPSIVRTAKIATTEADRIVRKLGSLDGATAGIVRERLIAQLG